MYFHYEIAHLFLLKKLSRVKVLVLTNGRVQKIVINEIISNIVFLIVFSLVLFVLIYSYCVSKMSWTIFFKIFQIVNHCQNCLLFILEFLNDQVLYFFTFQNTSFGTFLYSIIYKITLKMQINELLKF